MTAESAEVKKIIEMALLCSASPLAISALRRLFKPQAEAAAIRAAVAELRGEWENRALDLIETAGGFQFITRPECREFLARLNPQRPPRLSRQLLEVLAVIAYRQPATRGDIERIRGVVVSPQHLRFLEECGWIEAVGRRETAGRPTIFGTTKTLLDDLGLKSLDELPPLDDLESLDVGGGEGESADESAPPSSD